MSSTKKRQATHDSGDADAEEVDQSYKRTRVDEVEGGETIADDNGSSSSVPSSGDQGEISAGEEVTNGGAAAGVEAGEAGVTESSSSDSKEEAPSSSSAVASSSSSSSSSSSESDFESRFLVENAQVGAIIGKGGANIAKVREHSGANISVAKLDQASKASPQAERLMTVKGTVEAIAKAISMLAQVLLEERTAHGRSVGSNPDSIVIKMLAHRAAVGAIIGKGGEQIKQTIAETQCNVSVSTEVLGSSTDKQVTFTGTSQTLLVALTRVLTQLKNHPLRETTRVNNYVPNSAYNFPPQRYDRDRDEGRGRPYRDSGYSDREYYDSRYPPPPPPASSVNPYGGYPPPPPPPPAPFGYPPPPPPPPSDYDPYRPPPHHHHSAGGGVSGPEQTQKIAIPSVCAGVVIGKGGAIIREIRTASGCQISIAAAEESTPAERVVTITGEPARIQHAIFLIREAVEKYVPPSGGGRREE